MAKVKTNFEIELTRRTSIKFLNTFILLKQVFALEGRLDSSQIGLLRELTKVSDLFLLKIDQYLESLDKDSNYYRQFKSIKDVHKELISKQISDFYEQVTSIF